MAMNTTIFTGSGSAENEIDQTAAVLPEYVSYIKLCIMLISIPVVMIPTLWAIVIIIKTKKLQTNNNIFLINLLLTNVGFAVVLWCTEGLLTVLYLLGVDVDPDCRIIMIPLMLSFFANKLMFLPTCVDRFIHIAFPFSYKRIVTTKAIMTTIITLWMVTIVITTSIYINEPFDYIPSVGACKRKQTNIPQLLIILFSFITPIVLITITSIYLRYRIIKSTNFFHSIKRSAAQERKSHKAGRLAEILQEQVKPTLAVFRVGGIDAVLDILLALIGIVLNFLSPTGTTALIVTTQIVGVIIQYLQSANHAVVYNSDIREKMIGCIKMKNKQSKVTVLH